MGLPTYLPEAHLWLRSKRGCSNSVQGAQRGEGYGGNRKAPNQSRLHIIDPGFYDFKALLGQMAITVNPISKLIYPLEL
jgi:hypothetical protein